MTDLVDRFWAKVDKNGPIVRRGLKRCWMWKAGLDKAGYGRVAVKVDGTWTSRFAHRVCWDFIFGSVRDGLCVLHHCDNAACVNPGHLFLGTRVDNNHDRHDKGRSKGGSLVGAKHPQAKLSEASVRLIRKMSGRGVLHRSIASNFGVSEPQVSRIVSGRAWGLANVS